MKKRKASSRKPKTIQASNIFPPNEGGSESPKEKPVNGSSEKKGSVKKCSETECNAPKIPEKPCFICTKLSLCWGHVGKDGDHVCGCDCQKVYNQQEAARHDALCKASVAPVVPVSRKPFHLPPSPELVSSRPRHQVH